MTWTPISEPPDHTERVLVLTQHFDQPTVQIARRDTDGCWIYDDGDIAQECWEDGIAYHGIEVPAYWQELPAHHHKDGGKCFDLECGRARISREMMRTLVKERA